MRGLSIDAPFYNKTCFLDNPRKFKIEKLVYVLVECLGPDYVN